MKDISDCEGELPHVWHLEMGRNTAMIHYGNRKKILTGVGLETVALKILSDPRCSVAKSFLIRISVSDLNFILN